jgi:formate dehydrogenase maturation protein FdhE
MLKRVFTRRADRARKGKRETPQAQAVEFKDLITQLAQERSISLPAKLQKELLKACQQKDGQRRLYKLDLRKAGLTDAHVELLSAALKELPVVRKLDLRGNAITAQVMHAVL